MLPIKNSKQNPTTPFDNMAQTPPMFSTSPNETDEQVRRILQMIARGTAPQKQLAAKPFPIRVPEKKTRLPREEFKTFWIALSEPVYESMCEAEKNLAWTLVIDIETNPANRIVA